MRRILMAVVLLSMVFVAVPGTCLAQKVKAPPQKHDILQVSGVVKLIKDKKDKVAEIDLTTKDGVLYKITMNDAADPLKEQDGQTVSLSGFVQEMDGAKWFTISSEKKGHGDGQSKKNRKK